MSQIPSFKYHPDPIASGSIEQRDITCVCCGERRSYVYVGPVYGERDLDEQICPWCISSGLAHNKFGAEFTDIDAIGNYDPAVSLAPDIRAEIAFRNPGFNGWQQERWLVHCDDARAFLGPAGKTEIVEYGSQELIDSLRTDIGLSDEEFEDYFQKISRNSAPTAYVFRCLHCGQFAGYSDF